MKAVIQHNFSSGLGDCIIAIYQYIDTAINLKHAGYTVNLIVNQNKNLYFHKADFFNVFNLETFKSVFDSIEVLSEESSPLTQPDDLFHVYTLGSARPGMHWWDLFVDNKDLDIEKYVAEYTLYPQVSPVLPKEKNIFDSRVITKYKNQACNNKYVSIYFRSEDCAIGDYKHFWPNIEEVIQKNDQVFVCSNSVEFKIRLKELRYKNLIFNDIHLENIHGNHWGGALTTNREDSLLKTVDTILDMLFMKDSDHIYHFTEWPRTSNFLFLSKIFHVPVTSFYR